MLISIYSYKHDIVSCGRNYKKACRALVGGYFRNAAKKDPQEGYKTLLEGTPVYIHPSSALFNQNPEWYVNNILRLKRSFIFKLSNVSI